MKTTTVRITPDIVRQRQRWGDLLILQEAFEVGCDLIERNLMAMEKNDMKPKLLIKRNYYDSLEKVG